MPVLSVSASSSDTSMPTTPVDQDPPIYGTPYFSPGKGSYVMATHIVRPPAALAERGVRDVLQTTNPTVPIDPVTVLSVSCLER
jgi:hypothetical protein